MLTGTIHLDRFDPAQKECIRHTYTVPLKKETTVLQVLLHVYEHHDPTLAFRYGCRSGKCGECVVEVDGLPRLACLSRAKDGAVIAPLKNLPQVRDLVVDRFPLDKRIAEQHLYVLPAIENPLQTMPVSETYSRLIGCLECYGCVSSCPRFNWKDKSFGGPYVFIRLAQLQLDQRDGQDRRAQALSLGIEQCRDCTGCRCVKGIAIRRDAIETLLSGEVSPPAT
jgi:succinate dehydrogenase/fumarate reductase iron-sulfur protein